MKTIAVVPLETLPIPQNSPMRKFLSNKCGAIKRENTTNTPNNVIHVRRRYNKLNPIAFSAFFIFFSVRCSN
jgi:hypothetical protein